MKEKLPYIMVGLVKWRLILQWIGGIIMVPSVMVGTAVNFGFLDSAWAEPSLIGIGIALVPLLGSVACSLTYQGIKHNLARDNSYHQDVEHFRKLLKDVDEAHEKQENDSR